jgi:hypothetical protein
MAGEKHGICPPIHIFLCSHFAITLDSRKDRKYLHDKGQKLHPSVDIPQDGLLAQLQNLSQNTD